MRKEMLKVFEEFEQRRRLLKINGKLGLNGPRSQLYDKTSGVIKGKVYTIGAYSNVGKSKFAYSHVAYYLQNGLKVLFINLEVARADCLMGIIQAMDNCDYKDMMKWEIKLEPYENLMIRDDIYKLDEIVSCIKGEQADIVFIDFVQNIQAPGGSLYEQSSNIAKTIQRTAIETQSVIYSLSQLSNEMGRNANSGNTDFVSLKGGGEYFASSDVVFLLTKDGNEMVVKIAKNKFGPKGGEIVFNIDLSRNQFKYLRESSNGF